MSSFVLVTLLLASRRVEKVPQSSTWRNYCSETLELNQDGVSRFIHSSPLGGTLDLMSLVKDGVFSKINK